MLDKIRRTTTVVGAMAALALGGSAIAGAASSGSSTTAASPGSTATTPQQAPSGQRPDPAKGGHQANGKTEALLTGDTAAKVKAAALAKVGSGATVQRVETDADHGSPYEAHVTKSDGTEVEVLVDADFAVTAVNTMGHR
jgi:hypothetical protein